MPQKNKVGIPKDLPYLTEMFRHGYLVSQLKLPAAMNIKRETRDKQDVSEVSVRKHQVL